MQITPGYRPFESGEGRPCSARTSADFSGMIKEVTIERGLRMLEANTEGWESLLRGVDALRVNQAGHALSRSVLTSRSSQALGANHGGRRRWGPYTEPEHLLG
jgi:hypothetical protein